MYKGAGILLIRRQEGKTRILMGKRTIRPHKNFWSLSGGKMDGKDGGDFHHCALRETAEELFLGAPGEFEKLRNLTPLGSAGIFLPFNFQWKTYFYEVSHLDLSFRHNHEFSEIEWFDIEKLPEKTHYGIVYALWKLRSIGN
jgi:8-oxo-dGTP pyrophosphatase MutT (NUDIX family)